VTYAGGQRLCNGGTMFLQIQIIQELTSIFDGGIRYSIDRVDNTFLVRLAVRNRKEPIAGIASDLGGAVMWLREQVKIHYPNSEYAKRFLIN
jgi:hypothetical protein